MTPKKPPPGTQQILLPFQQPQGQQRADVTSFLHEQCQRPFLPLGLFLWGSTAETWITRLSVGNRYEGSLSHNPIAGRYFESGRTMEQLLELAAAGELELSVEARQVLVMGVAMPGVNVCLDISGPYQAACLWGLTYAFGGPVTAVVVEKADHANQSHVSGFKGSIVERRLGGDVATHEVWAPSEDSVCRLLGQLGRSQREHY